MKLILCQNCQDVFKLSVKEERTCACGKCKGQYEPDGLCAWYSGKNAVPLFFSNPSLVKAMDNRQDKSYSDKSLFTAGVVEYDCKRFKDITNG